MIPNFQNKTAYKKVIGIVLIILGIVSLITPLTPGSWLIFIGLEFIGVRISFWDKIKEKLKNMK